MRVTSPVLQPRVPQQPTVVVQLETGATIEDSIRHLVHLANSLDQPHEAMFNNTRLVARPGDTTLQVKKTFDDAMAAEREATAAAEAAAMAQRAARLAEVPRLETPPSGFVLDPQGMGVMSCPLGDLALIRADQLTQLPAGTVLHSIMGREAVVGVDPIDTDTMRGFLGYGFLTGPLGGPPPASTTPAVSAREFQQTLTALRPASLGFDVVETGRSED